MKKCAFLLLIFSFISICEAGTIRLVNNSNYKLRAVIQGLDGSSLGEMVLNPHTSNTWTESLGSFNAPNSSQTPYTVLWYCLEGGDYGVCDNISPGGTAAAQSCLGTRVCKPPKKKPAGQTEEYIQVPPEERQYPQGQPSQIPTYPKGPP